MSNSNQQKPSGNQPTQQPKPEEKKPKGRYRVWKHGTLRWGGKGHPEKDGYVASKQLQPGDTVNCTAEEAAACPAIVDTQADD